MWWLRKKEAPPVTEGDGTRRQVMRQFLVRVTGYMPTVAKEMKDRGVKSPFRDLDDWQKFVASDHKENWTAFMILANVILRSEGEEFGQQSVWHLFDNYFGLLPEVAKKDMAMFAVIDSVLNEIAKSHLNT
jgi:hypothetical protein